VNAKNSLALSKESKSSPNLTKVAWKMPIDVRTNSARNKPYVDSYAIGNVIKCTMIKRPAPDVTRIKKAENPKVIM